MTIENLVAMKVGDVINRSILRKSNFTFNNPTVSTGIALNADPTAIVDTEASLIIDNPLNKSDGTKNPIVTVVKSIKLTNTVVGTGATKAKLAFFKDSIVRFSSGGTPLTGVPTTASSNSSDIGTAITSVNFGDVTALAVSAAGEDHLFTQLIKSDTTAAPCFDVDDEFLFTTLDVGKGNNNLYDSAGVADNSFGMPLIYLMPGSSLLVKSLFPNASAAASFEIMVNLYELGSC